MADTLVITAARLKQAGWKDLVIALNHLEDRSGAAQAEKQGDLFKRPWRIGQDNLEETLDWGRPMYALDLAMTSEGRSTAR